MRLLWILLAVLLPTSAGAEGPRVVASIKPLHSLAAAVMAGTGEPELLVDGAQSAHGFQLKPSQRKRIEQAEVVFTIGDALEQFLAKPLKDAKPDVTAVAMAGQEGITLLKPRTAALWPPHTYAIPDAGGAYDPHLWLDPQNAKVIVRIIEKTLSARYPQHAEAYRRNVQTTLARLDALNAELKAVLAPVRPKPFIVSHDAFQYFERAYSLNGIGAIALEPEQPPGARRVEAVREAIREHRIRCAFHDPQSGKAALKAIMEGNTITTAVLDEQGADIAAGEELYFTLMRRVGEGMRGCLGR